MQKILYEKKYILFLIFFIVCVFAFFLIFLSPQKLKVIKQDNTLRIGGMFDRDIGFNPLFAQTSDNFMLFTFVFSSLISVNEKGQAIGNLAKECIIAPDNTSITFYLKDNTTFHDGTPLTSETIKWSYNRYLNQKSTTNYSYLSFIDSMETLDKKTITFHFKREVLSPEYYFSIEILPCHLNADKKNSSFKTHPIGSGPYVFSSMDEKGNILLKRNESFYDKKGKPLFISFKSYPNKEALWAAFMREEIDIFRNLSYESFKMIQNASWCNISYSSDLQYYMIALNKRHPFLKNNDVRTAIDMAINRKEIIETIYHGRANESFGPLPAHAAFFFDELKKRKFDPRKAKKILRELGFVDLDNDGIIEKDNTPFVIHLYYFDNFVRGKSIAKLIKLQLQKIGIFTKIIRATNPDDFLKKITDKNIFSCYINAQPSFSSELAFVYWLKDMGLKAQSLDAINLFTDIYKQLIHTANTSKKKDIYKKLQLIIHEEKSCLFLIQPYQLLAYNKRLNTSGISFAPYFRLDSLKYVTFNKGGEDGLQNP